MKCREGRWEPTSSSLGGWPLWVSWVGTRERWGCGWEGVRRGRETKRASVAKGAGEGGPTSPPGGVAANASPILVYFDNIARRPWGCMGGRSLLLPRSLPGGASPGEQRGRKRSRSFWSYSGGPLTVRSRVQCLALVAFPNDWGVRAPKGALFLTGLVKRDTTVQGVGEGSPLPSL